MNIKHFIASATAAAIVGSLGVSVAGAVNRPAQTSPPTTASPAQARAPRPVAPGALAGALETSAKTIGITRKDLRRELRDRKTVAAVATAHNVQPQAVVDALVAAGTKKIDDAQAAGKLGETRAAKLKAALPARAQQFVNKERQGAGLPPVVGRELDAAATAIGIDRAALASELRGGKTIAQVATAHGVDPQHVIDVLVQAANKRIVQRQQTQQQRASRRISTFVNTWKP